MTSTNGTVVPTKVPTSSTAEQRYVKYQQTAEQQKKKKKQKGMVDIETLYSFNLNELESSELQQMKKEKMEPSGLTKKHLAKAMKFLPRIVENDAKEQNMEQSQQKQDSEAHARIPSPSRKRHVAESGSVPAPCDSQKSCESEPQPKKTMQRGTAQNVDDMYDDMWHAHFAALALRGENKPEQAHPIKCSDVQGYPDDVASEEDTTDDEVSDDGETNQEDGWYDFVDAISILGKAALSMITSLTPDAAEEEGTALNDKATEFALSSYFCSSARSKPSKDLLQSAQFKRKRVPQYWAYKYAAAYPTRQHSTVYTVHQQRGDDNPQASVDS